jgi:hypothetical protein
MIKIIAAGNTARNIGKINTDSGGFTGLKNRKIGKFTHGNLLSFQAGLFKNTVKSSRFYIPSMIWNGYTAIFGGMFKLDMRAVLFIYKPAVITQKFQNFPYRHTISIRVVYTYIKLPRSIPEGGRKRAPGAIGRYTFLTSRYHCFGTKPSGGGISWTVSSPQLYVISGLL